MKQNTAEKERDTHCAHIYVCMASSIDRDTNLLSLTNLIEEIGVNVSKKDFPLKEKSEYWVASNIEVIVVWQKNERALGSELKFPYELQLIDPSGKVLMGEMTDEVNMNPTHKRYRGRFKFNGIKITTPGLYYFRVVSKEFGRMKIALERPISVGIKEI